MNCVWWFEWSWHKVLVGEPAGETWISFLIFLITDIVTSILGV